jgi:hypothetical protein
VRCDCLASSQLWGDEAKAYAERHLKRVGPGADSRTIVYACPETEHRWVEDRPGSGERMRLRKLVSGEEDAGG